MSLDVLETVKPDFDEEAFVASTYNKTYYSNVMEDEARLIEWQAGALHNTITAHLQTSGIDRFPYQWEAGSGPSVHHLFALEKYSDAIHLSDYMPDNLAEIRKWVERDTTAHDWSPFVRQVLIAEGMQPTESDVEARMEAVRSKITSYLPLDLKSPTADMRAYKAPFVTSFFVADSATGDKAVFKEMTKNAFDIVDKGGLFVATYLGGCKHYKVGDQWVVSADIDHADIEDAFAECDAVDVQIERFNVPSMAEEGFDHIFTVSAVRA